MQKLPHILLAGHGRLGRPLAAARLAQNGPATGHASSMSSIAAHRLVDMLENLTTHFNVPPPLQGASITRTSVGNRNKRACFMAPQQCASMVRNRLRPLARAQHALVHLRVSPIHNTISTTPTSSLVLSSTPRPARPHRRGGGETRRGRSDAKPTPSLQESEWGGKAQGCSQNLAGASFAAASLSASRIGRLPPPPGSIGTRSRQVGSSPSPPPACCRGVLSNKK